MPISKRESKIFRAVKIKINNTATEVTQSVKVIIGFKAIL